MPLNLFFKGLRGEGSIGCQLTPNKVRGEGRGGEGREGIKNNSEPPGHKY